MATIKPIEGRSVHQIQSGQVIVDLCSVVKELVENSLDAGATSVEVRFKGSGLDAIEVQDNGHGVAPEDYETIALKHYTSKLSSYDDLSALRTFGFRGEALSSLCALSSFHIVTARAEEAPRGTKLDFEHSGRLQNKSVIASQRGTTIVVEGIFKNLPVRRKELERNIKREYGKALGLLQAYACISTGVRFSVSNQAGKGSKAVAFSTKANPTTKENISNVYGAKTVLALVELDLALEMLSHPTSGTQSLITPRPQPGANSADVKVTGWISKPVVGKGRATPDRQMFFVNSRPCALPQVSKAINEVYKSFNVTQSPFIFANLLIDTNAYDVNVSPDKRTILLHDQAALLESIKTALTELFDRHDQTVPSATVSSKRAATIQLLAFKRPEISHDDGETPLTGAADPGNARSKVSLGTAGEESDQADKPTAAANRVNGSVEREAVKAEPELLRTGDSPHPHESSTARAGLRKRYDNPSDDLSAGFVLASDLVRSRGAVTDPAPRSSPVGDIGEVRETDRREPSDQRTARQTSIEDSTSAEPPITAVSSGSQKQIPGPVPNAFDRMRPKRMGEEAVVVTVGGQTTHMTLGSSKQPKTHTPRSGVAQGRQHGSSVLSKSLQSFAAPGSQANRRLEHPAESEDDDLEPTTSTPDSLDTHFSDTKSSEVSDVVDTEEEGLDDDANQSLFVEEEEGGSDDEYVDEDDKKRREEARVARMIAKVEEAAAKPSQDNIKRATNALKGRTRKESTLKLIHNLESSVTRIDEGLRKLDAALQECAAGLTSDGEGKAVEPAAKSAEERLSLTVTKSDFEQMRIVGQFNLGFILAVRPSTSANGHGSDELFIIDQHAADEKYNFERLSATTVVQNQRLVHPKPLELTAVEEEIIVEHSDILSQNGFRIDTDESGGLPVGRRCKLVGLPMSKEVTFTVRDLEELIALLGDSSTDTTMASESIVRPSKVRKMLAMRACRSSIMVGRGLTGVQMSRVVRHMGEMDKPWNCPHGRPTMRHLYGMDGWEDGWAEGRGVVGLGADLGHTDWKGYLQATTT